MPSPKAQGAHGLPAGANETPRRHLGKLLLATVLLTALLAVAEILCRTVLGLGDPPLSQADPQIEYLFKPSQTVHRFHHLIHINAWSMRSDDFPAHKASPDEIRVMVIGDSVVYDGVQIDQEDIATEVLKRDLQRDLKHPVVVGNIAAKSWGPPNELAYVRRFGLFDADKVVLVLSSHDYADVPTFDPVVDVDPDYPGHKPLLALSELFTRYVPRYIHALSGRSEVPAEDKVPTQKDISWGLFSERDLIRLVEKSGAKILLAQMLERGEIDGHPKPGNAMIRQVAESEQVPVLNIGQLFEQSVHSGANPYLDNIHPNKLGCRIMGDSIAKAVESL